MNKAMGLGIAERWMYTAFLAAAMQGVNKGWWDGETAIYIATGALGAISSVRGWWVNRPQRLLDDAAASLPKNVNLAMVPNTSATHDDKNAVRDLAASTSGKVTATT